MLRVASFTQKRHAMSCQGLTAWTACLMSQMLSGLVPHVRYTNREMCYRGLLANLQYSIVPSSAT
jgi:hypothetical protein